MQKHKMIVQNYYLRYLGGYDAQLMRDVVMVGTCRHASVCVCVAFTVSGFESHWRQLIFL